MPFSAFAERVEENERKESSPWRHYMQTGLAWSAAHGKGTPVGGLLHTPCGEFERARLGSRVVADLEKIDWDWLAGACDTAECEGFHSCTLWAGHGGGCTPLHFDAMSNFFNQASNLVTHMKKIRSLLYHPPSTPWARTQFSPPVVS